MSRMESSDHLVNLCADVLAPLQVLVAFHCTELLNVNSSSEEAATWILGLQLCISIVMCKTINNKIYNIISYVDVFEITFWFISYACLFANIVFKLHYRTSNLTLYPFLSCFGVYFVDLTNAKFMKLVYSIRQTYPLIWDNFKFYYLVKPCFIILLIYPMDFGSQKVTGSLLKTRHVRPTNCSTGQFDTTTEPFLNSNVSMALFHMKTSLSNGETIVSESNVYTSDSESNQSYLLLNKARFERRICEDVSFNCIVSITDNATESELSNGELQEYQWRKNERIFNTSSKRIHTTSSRRFTNESKIWVTYLLLTITCIEQTDFGNYECVHVVEISNLRSEIYMGRYMLVALPDCDETAVSVSIGTPIITSYATTLNVQSDDLSVHYSINGKDINEYSDTCPFTSRIIFFAQQLVSGLNRYSCIWEIRSNGIFSLHCPSCPYTEILGVHRISMFRILEYTPIPVEIHLKSFIVVPEFTPWKNNTSSIKALDVSRLNKTTGQFDDVVLDVIQQRSELPVFYDIAWIFLSLVALGLCLILGYVCCVWFYRFSVLNLCDKIFYGRRNTTSSSNNGEQTNSRNDQNDFTSSSNNEEQTNNRNDQKKFAYDIFISSCEEDDHIVSTWLVPHLEQLGFCVYFPGRDVRPGEPELRSIDKALHQSRKVLIVLSENYLNDQRCMEMQLISLCLEPLYQHEMSEEDLVFIKIDGAQVPRYLLRFAETNLKDVRSMLHENPTSI